MQHPAQDPRAGHPFGRGVPVDCRHGIEFGERADDPHKPATAKTQKAALLYQNRPHEGQHCGDCKYFSPEGSGAGSGTCALVEGVINRDGWCVAYAART